MTEELKVGSSFWALNCFGWSVGGDPMDFTIVGETKTLWKIKRTSIPDHKPFPAKKDMSEWRVISAEDAQKIAWMRKHSRSIADAVEKLAKFEWKQQIANYETMKAIAKLIGYGEAHGGTDTE